MTSSRKTKARALECLIEVDKALLLKQRLKQCGYSASRLFICKYCKRPVKPLQKGRAEDGRPTPAHFEHLKRNIECPLSDKTQAKQLYAKRLRDKAKARAKRT